MHDGVPTVCVPVPGVGGCVRPYHDTSLINGGGPHNEAAAAQDVNAGAMNGFAAAAPAGRKKGCALGTLNPVCTSATVPNGVPRRPRLSHRGRVPNYWAYAEALRAAGPHVRGRLFVEPPGAPRHGVGVERDLQRPDGSR